MKHYIKVLAFVAAAIGLTILSLQGTNAQNAPMQLQIDPGSVSCVYSGFDMGTTGTSFSDRTLTEISLDIWRCLDLQGTTNNRLRVIVSTSISNGTTTIPNTGVTMSNIPLIYQDCINGVQLGATGQSLNNTVDLIRKNIASDVCTYSIWPELSVIVPGQSTVGNYSGILTITFP